tara:strand:+ start:362 stop:1408 length:1047 start_codon:yes stop_codon:yes gene_type:complete
MNLIKNISTLVISLLLSFFVAELIFRSLEIGYGNNPLESSKIYHHVHPLNYTFRIHDPHGEYGGHNIYYDEKGFRVENNNVNILKDSDNLDSIIFLGDSFTEAVQVPYKDTFASLTGLALGFPVINLGVSSYSPMLYKLQSKKILSQFSGRTVIMQIYANDFRSDKSFFDSAIFENNELVAIDGGKNNFLIRLLRKSYVARYLRKSQLTIKAIVTGPTFFSITNDIKFQNTVTDEHIKFTVKTIKEISEILNNQNKKLHVFMVPTKHLSVQNLCCKEDKLYNKFYNELFKHKISTIDMAYFFEKYEDQKRLFFDLDAHFTKEGNKLVASAIVSFLNQKEPSLSYNIDK